MQILLACAKDMVAGSQVAVPHLSKPLFVNEAQSIIAKLQQLSVAEIAKMLSVSDEIAALNKQRYADFSTESGNAAILSYFGVAYKHLRAAELSGDVFEYAQKHMWITSFLYGLLRPLDQICNYRLEGKAPLAKDGKSVFSMWKPLLTDVLIDSVKADDGVLLNAASEEMKRLFDWKKVEREITIVQPDFKVLQGGKMKSISSLSKMCRGALVRYVIENRINSPEAIDRFEYEGFKCDGSISQPLSPMFVCNKD